LTPSSAKNSRVTRVDLAGPTLETIVPQAPIRIVGAGVSTCVSVLPQ
jgi:hypothetical protein